IASGGIIARETFWSVVETQGSPLIEKLPGNDREVLATFVWKDPGDTKSVIVNARMNGVDPLSDPRSQMQQLPGTNVWYVSHRFPASAEFLYQLVVNLPDVGGSPATAAMQRALRPDPLNHNPYPDTSDPLFDPAQPWRNGSIARMPGVPDNPWLTRKQ